MIHTTASSWEEFFGGHYEFHLAMTRYVLFGKRPGLDGVTNADLAWDECIKDFFVPARAAVIIEGLKMQKSGWISA